MPSGLSPYWPISVCYNQMANAPVVAMYIKSQRENFETPDFRAKSVTSFENCA